jgi:hypothetical protein
VTRVNLGMLRAALDDESALHDGVGAGVSPDRSTRPRRTMTTVQTTFSGNVSTKKVKASLRRLAKRLRRTPRQILEQVVRSGIEAEQVRQHGPHVAITTEPGGRA